ncbi:MAG: exosortase C-terminal domain/associated protein EpsI, partial [Pyrinomonadaceae bacterium]
VISASVMAHLGVDWWHDENYSHGLLVPFVIGMIIWRAWDALNPAAGRGSTIVGGGAIVIAILLLIAGTLGAELFIQRISLVLMLAGLTVYFFGTRLLNLLAVPFALLLLAIPIPQIVFNRIAFPLQIWASQMAVWGIRLFEVPTLRKGNVIDILPRGATQTISLEVVEACSGIRSLMTLVTLALILAYFTRRNEGRLANLSTPDFWRAVLLMLLAVPIAVLTNAARVTATGVLTYYYGKQATEGTWHDLSGWLVYVVALGLLLGANYLLKLVFRGGSESEWPVSDGVSSVSRRSVLPVIVLLIAAGAAVNWFALRSEASPPRSSLSELPATLGEWRQKGNEIRFGEAVESVLKTTDYTMREYTLPDGRVANIYVGYYASQRTGATYHSPQNCLPGSGWVMTDPQYVDITTPDGRTFQANRYTLENGPYKEVMIYWYQGRGRTAASEYTDKINTVWDSVTRSRTDGALVRVMTTVGPDEPAAERAAIDLSAALAASLSSHVPD